MRDDKRLSEIEARGLADALVDTRVITHRDATIRSAETYGVTYWYE